MSACREEHHSHGGGGHGHSHGAGGCDGHDHDDDPERGFEEVGALQCYLVALSMLGPFTRSARTSRYKHNVDPCGESNNYYEYLVHIPIIPSRAMMRVLVLAFGDVVEPLPRRARALF